jgi:hypothetical protein
MMWNGSTAATSVLATVTCTLPGGRDSATHFTYCMQDVASYAGTSTTEDADNGHSHAQAWTCTSAEGMKCSNSWSKCVDSKGKAVESENSTTPGVRERFVVVVLAALVAAMVVA